MRLVENKLWLNIVKTWTVVLKTWGHAYGGKVRDLSNPCGAALHMGPVY